MLEEVLREIKNAGYISKANIAAALGINTGLIEDAISQLIRLGYLKVSTENEAMAIGHCDRQCAGCPVGRHCTQQLPVNLFTITNKGEKLLS